MVVRLLQVLYVSERVVIGVGFDCNPMIFVADERGLWYAIFSCYFHDCVFVAYPISVLSGFHF